MQKQARITSKGQITVPADIRRALNLKEGDKLIFSMIGDTGSHSTWQENSAGPVVVASKVECPLRWAR